MRKEIEVIIKNDGSLVIEAKGYKGAECEKATKALMDALVIKSHKKKPEYYAQSNTVSSVGIGRN